MSLTARLVYLFLLMGALQIVMNRDYLERILTARVYDVAQRTALDHAPILSQRLANTVLLKREDQQSVFSFKIRGAYNMMSRLSDAARERGVICASAGNHAQGVALSGRHLGIRTLIVMPRTTPRIKVEAVRRLGGRVILHGDSYDEASAHANALMDERGLTWIPPFDHPDIIAGQGTVGMEILQQHPDPIDAVFVCVGGGGLIAGVAAYIKLLRPETRIIGVEPQDAGSLHAAMAAGHRVKLEQVGLFADGVAVRQVGEETFRLARQYVDEVILVGTDEICAAIRDVFDDTRSIMEPAGALGVAGLKAYVEREGVRDQRLVAIASGANINFNRLGHVAERAEVGEHREAVLAVTIPERPGSFRAFCEAIGSRGVTEFNYRLCDPENAQIFVGVQLNDGRAEREAVIGELRAAGYPVLDLSDDELAKGHVRHMVGGRGRGVVDEVLFRFEFPERPGALLNFLTRLGEGFNISLFHYRNHGAAYGRVLVGVQVPPGQRQRFAAFLDQLGYRYHEETDNPAYRLFLA